MACEEKKIKTQTRIVKYVRSVGWPKSNLFCTMFILIFIKLVCIFRFIWAATHWVVTQDGRIAPQVNISNVQYYKWFDVDHNMSCAT